MRHYTAKLNQVLIGVPEIAIITVDFEDKREMAVISNRTPALLYQTSAVGNLLSMLFVSVLILVSTPDVHSHSMIAQFFKRAYGSLEHSELIWFS